MSWWSLLPGAVALLALVLLPGTLALRLLGIRGLAGAAAAAPVTLSAVGALSVLLAAAGISWRLPAVLLSLTTALLVLAGIVWLAVRRSASAADTQATWRPAPLGTCPTVAVALAIVVGALALAAPLVLTLPSADAPLQQWDGVFHLNAVVVARDTGVITPLGGLAPLYGGGTLAPYYPTGWHALLAIAPGLESVPGATPLSDEQIAQVGLDVGVPQEVVDTFTDGRFNDWVVAATEHAAGEGVGGTPTVLIDGEELEPGVWQNPGALAQTIRDAA